MSDAEIDESFRDYLIGIGADLSLYPEVRPLNAAEIAAMSERRPGATTQWDATFQLVSEVRQTARNYAEENTHLAALAQKNVQIKALQQGEAKCARAEQEALSRGRNTELELKRQRFLTEDTLQQKATVEMELNNVRELLRTTEHQKGLLEDELSRRKDKVTEETQRRKLAERELVLCKAHSEAERVGAQTLRRSRSFNDLEQPKEQQLGALAKELMTMQEALREVNRSLQALTTQAPE